MKSILLTGASGVIGMPLLIKFIKTNPLYSITATYRNESTFLVESLKKEFQAYPENLKLISYKSLLKYSNSLLFDEIWHFATYGQPVKALNEAVNTVNLNVNDLILLVKLLKTDGLFYYASTSEMYGEQENAKESDIPISNPISKRAVYTESKRLGEALLSTLIPNNHIIFRICLVYSQYAKKEDTRVMYQFIQKGVQENRINMLDAGAAKRQYCFIDDAVTMMTNVRDYATYGNMDYLGIWNIANPYQVSIRELAEIIGGLTNSPVNLPKSPESPVLDALNNVSIIPDRYFKFFGDFSFKRLEDTLPDIIKSYTLELEKKNNV